MRWLYSRICWLTDSMAASNGFRAACSSGLSPSAFSGFMFRTLHPRSRSPYDFASPRAVLTSAVRARTSPARARIVMRSACACTLRCFTGYSNSGSILANRASVCASSRSSFLRLSPISRTLRAFATITSCPKSLSKRLIQGECVPISSAIRLRGMAPKTSCNTFAVVRTRCSSCIRPASSSTQYQLLRSPRSSPMVSFCREIFLLCFVAAVLTFFIAGLLFICASSTSITWERTASRRRPAFSSHLITTIDLTGDWQDLKGSSVGEGLLEKAMKSLATSAVATRHSSLVPQRHHRFQLRRSPRRQQARRDGHCPQSGCRQHQCQRIVRLQSIQQRRCRFSRCHRQHGADHNADDEQAPCLAHHHCQDLSRRRAQRHPDPDLVRPAGHRVPDHPVQPNRRQHRGQDPKKTRQHRQQALAQKPVFDLLVIRMKIDRNAAVHLRDRSLHFVDHRDQLQVGTHHHLRRG